MYHLKTPNKYLMVSGGAVIESMDQTDENVPFWLSIQYLKAPPKILFHNVLHLASWQGKQERTAALLSHECFLGHFLTR